MTVADPPLALPAAGEPPGPPEWDSVTHEVRCPLCDYNLFGLVEARCPECGAPFDWSYVLDPGARLHPYLYEHHPELPVRSWLRTVAGTMLPRRFWRSLHLLQRVRARRLATYALIGYALLLFGLMAAGFLQMCAEFSALRWPWLMRARGTGLVQPDWDSLADFINSGRPMWYVAFWGGCLFWLGATFASLMIFRISMRRSKVFVSHVMRCVVYSFDPATWFVLCLVYMLHPIATIYFDTTLYIWADLWAAATIIGAFTLSSYRLWMAYWLYLRFKHSFFTVMASQLIVILLGLNALAVPAAWF